MVSVDVDIELNYYTVRAQELCESGGGRPGLPVPNRLVFMVSVDVDIELNYYTVRAQGLCESRGGRAGLPVPNRLVFMVSVDVDIELNYYTVRAQELCESGGGRPALPVPNSPHGFCLWTESNIELELFFLFFPSLFPRRRGIRNSSCCQRHYVS